MMDQDIHCKIIPSINDREVAPRSLNNMAMWRGPEFDTSLYITWTGGIHSASTVDEYL